MAKVFVWHNGNDGLWYVDSETTIGNSWSTEYIRLAGGFGSKEDAEREACLWKYDSRLNGYKRVSSGDLTRR